MSAGSLPAMYGGVSIAISYAKHPAHRHSPHGATHAWHGRANETKAVAEAVRPSPRGLRSVALDETPRYPASIRHDELPSLRIPCVGQAVRCAALRCGKSTAVRVQCGRTEAPHVVGKAVRLVLRTSNHSQARAAPGRRAARPPPAPQSAPRGARRRAGGRSQRHLAHLGREVERRADEPRLGRAVRQHVERTADAEVRELDHAIPARPRAVRMCVPGFHAKIGRFAYGSAAGRTRLAARSPA